MRQHIVNGTPVIRRARLALTVIASLLIGSSCNENLPFGPNNFSAQIQIIAPHDTVVAGDSGALQAKATDSNGHVIQALTFAWTSADSTILGFAVPASVDLDATNGRTRAMIGRRTGRSVVTLSLPDPRFSAASVTRTETVVVGGVRVLSTHDSTLTAVNDTGVAIAAGLVHVNGSLINRISQGVRWTHLGLHTAVVGQGDTIKYIAKTNGQDTLIAGHDFCLAGAKCADTVVVHVSQQLTLSLSTRNFAAWSFGDSVGPTVTLADRRGNGLPGSSVRLVPVTPADSAIVKVTGPIGLGNPATGQLAAPLLVAAGNGTARVLVLGISSDGASVVAIDSVKEVVRQVARHVAVEALRVTFTANDSIPIRVISRDARGSTIADATTSVTGSGVLLNGNWSGPTPATGTAGATSTGSLTPEVMGAALPANNPQAPQVPVIVDPQIITLVQNDTAVAGTTPRTISVLLLDSLGRPAVGRWVRFGASFGPFPDSVQADGTGLVSTTWVPRDSAMTYTLTGVRGTPTALNTVADSAGRVVIRRSIVVIADVPSATEVQGGSERNEHCRWRNGRGNGHGEGSVQQPGEECEADRLRSLVGCRMRRNVRPGHLRERSVHRRPTLHRRRLVPMRFLRRSSAPIFSLARSR